MPTRPTTPGGTPPRRTSSTASKRRARFALLAATALAATACSADAQPRAERPDDYACAVSAGSPEAKLLSRVMRTDSFTTRNGYPGPRFVEKAQDRLREYGKEGKAPTVRQCFFFPDGRSGNGRTTVEYAWVPPSDARRGTDAAGTRRYSLNGATGRSGDVTTDLYVRCELPGELKEPSKKVLLHAGVSFTTNLGTVEDHGTQDQQMSFVYLMTRRATELLGCENRPLEKDPVVKPLDGSASR
ncbi:hypothetical protein [Streptomyces sp. NPDC058861]|uniref:hypothetical protein n=1 Tax=Streptomyces sp. NPDC058861 TaxID=3346653 RepID=UPI00369F6F5D